MRRFHHAILSLCAEVRALQDSFHHLKYHGEPDLSHVERVTMLSQLDREMKDIRAAISILRLASELPSSPIGYPSRRYKPSAALDARLSA